MKRRNVEATKHRKQFHFKKCKFAESIYASNSFIYLKFFCIWILVMLADYVLEFRFEFLWPLWLVIRSLHDSFKYQGIIFSLFFALIAILSDLLCYMFLPVQWIFFAASTYVWVQYVWHTDKGVCLSTISLWLLFVYVEASFRLKSIDKSIENFCKPFAAHCIGYPMVTLGFGFKSYLCFKLRLKKQKEIQKSNQFYLELIGKALPLELQQLAKKKDKFKELNYEEEISSQNTLCPNEQHNNNTNTLQSSSTSSLNSLNKQATTTKSSSSLLKTTSSSLIASALSFYLNSYPSSNCNTQTNQQQSQSPQNQHHQIEDLPYIQQKDTNSTTTTLTTTTTTNSTRRNGGKNSSFSNNYTQTTSNDPNNLLTETSKYNNNSHNRSSSSNSSNGGSSSCSSSSSSSSSSRVDSNSTTTTTTYNLQPSLSNNNQTNININMTINTAAISAATATATATSGENQLSPESSTKARENNNDASSNSHHHSKKSNKSKSDKCLTNGTSNGHHTSSSSSNASKLSNGDLKPLLNPKSQKLKTSNLNTKLKKQEQSSSPIMSNNNGDIRESHDNDSDSYSVVSGLEDDLRKVKSEIEQQKTVEEYLRNQINYITKCDKAEKLKLEKLQKDNEALLTKYAKLTSIKQKEKEDWDILEKRLQDEKRTRLYLELQLTQEKKLKDDTTAPQCTEICKKRSLNLENDLKILSDECRKKEARLVLLENQVKLAETRFDSLMSAFKCMEEKNFSLQESLSAETRFKLDLFSALGETRRQLEAVQFGLESKERELNAFKSIFKQTLSVPSISSNAAQVAQDTSQNDLISQYLANQLNSLQTSNNSGHGSPSPI